MNKKSFNRNAILGALLLGMTSLSLTGCGQKTSEEHVLAARQFVEANDNKSAIIEYKSAIQKDPRDATARFELGKLYIDQGNYAAAEKELNRALDLGYNVSQVVPLISLAYKETNSEVALSEIDHNVDGLTSVERAEVTYYKLEALLRLEKKGEARILLDEIAQIDSSSVYKGLSLALGYVLEEDIETALAEVNKLHEQAPLNKEVLIQQARLNMFMRNVDEAIEAYQAYLEVEPDDIETKFLLSSILMDTKRFDEAEPIVDELLKLSADNGLLNRYKGVIKARDGKFAESLKYLETAIQSGQNDPLVRLLAGFSAYQLHNYEVTTRHLSMIATDLPPSHPGLRMLADSLLHLGKNEEATDVLAKVDGEVENDALLFSKAGYQLLKEGNVVDARAMIDKSVPIATTSEDLTRLGVLQLSINDAEGLVNLEAAVERSPELSIGQQTLANAYTATGQYDKALEVADNWQQNEPDNVGPWLVRGQVYIAQKDYDAAAKAISAAEALDSKNIPAKLQRVSLAMINQQPEQALAAVNDALKIDATDQTALALLYIVQSQLGNPGAAIDYMKGVVSRNPNNNVPKIVLSRVYLGERKIDEGVALIEQVAVNDSTPDIFWDTKGRLLLAAIKVDEAKAHYQSWLDKQPNSKPAVMGMAMILDLEGKFDTGATLLGEFLEKRPDRQVSIVRAYFLSMLRQIPETEAILNTLSKEQREIPYVKGITARLQLYRNQPEQALPNAEAAYQAIPNIRNLLLVMAAYEMTGKADAALAVVTDFLEKNPTNTQALLLQAERLISRDRAAAIDVYRDLVKLQPDNAIALNNLAFLEQEEGLLDAAEEHARSAFEIVSNSPEVADTLAQILIDKDDLEEAKAIYEQAMTGPVNSDEVFLNYVELLLKMDFKPLAERRLASRTFESAESKARVAELKQQYSL
ncbi:XrtA/PEP-CTERM system TPR-repeat protein PrsT [Alteromonas lipolytica]|uniref:PEP-CTERM system TPR-repeat protein PrsT n=1 Tax=Alteromonas lipolytica TaxID=1856405 RepID=A0A1E8FF00_9ALTE|nr:XrtA/PEP-CTERM system TPR-repeat protein PrsT [Alteromonas lipolytica]OFI34491.1 hypothetical protein BFC17_17810 [Alteromonas lipolytica]GGF84997.1 lipoprotein [Alteromonas lipolytica]